MAVEKGLSRAKSLSQMKKFLFLRIVLVMFASGATQQELIDAIAEHVRNASGLFPNCTAPNLTECTVDVLCKGTNCGKKFDAKVDSNGIIHYLFE